jgi:hypothetical protein
MKYYVVTLLSVLAVGCGGSSDSGVDKKPEKEQEVVVSDCIVENDTISLASGGICNLTDIDAGTYSTSSGEVSCDNGVLTYGSGTFSSANAGITFNGLTFMCAVN